MGRRAAGAAGAAPADAAAGGAGCAGGVTVACCDWEGGVTGGTEIGVTGVVLRGVATGLWPSGGVRTPGNVALGTLLGGVGVRGCDGGVAIAGLALGAGCTNGRGGVGREANASPIGSDWTSRCGPDILIPTGMTPPHAEQRARTPPCGTFAGSTL
jgi:hypothetical protein